MKIIIQPEELLPEFVDDWKAGLIWNPTIDYADNAIYAVHEKTRQQIIIFYFKQYGWMNDNRYNTYDVSVEDGNIVIDIWIPKYLYVKVR